jgi:hypothetical protein
MSTARPIRRCTPQGSARFSLGNTPRIAARSSILSNKRLRARVQGGGDPGCSGWHRRSVPPQRPMPERTRPTLPRDRSDWGMPPWPQRDYRIAGSAAPRNVRSLRWSIERAKEKRGSLSSPHALSPSAHLITNSISIACGLCSCCRQNAQRVALPGVSLPSLRIFPSDVHSPRGNSQTVALSVSIVASRGPERRHLTPLDAAQFNITIKNHWPQTTGFSRIYVPSGRHNSTLQLFCV